MERRQMQDASVGQLILDVYRLFRHPPPSHSCFI